MTLEKRNPFNQKVFEIVSRIPCGKVVSYGQIAAFLGSPRSSRTVGWAMHHCPKGYPWHRVVMKSGKLPFADMEFDSISQRDVLEKEGVSFLEDGTIDMKKNVWQIELPL